MKKKNEALSSLLLCVCVFVYEMTGNFPGKIYWGNFSPSCINSSGLTFRAMHTSVFTLTLNLRAHR